MFNVILILSSAEIKFSIDILRQNLAELNNFFITEIHNIEIIRKIGNLLINIEQQINNHHKELKEIFGKIIKLFDHYLKYGCENVLNKKILSLSDQLCLRARILYIIKNLICYLEYHTDLQKNNKFIKHLWPYEFSNNRKYKILNNLYLKNLNIILKDQDLSPKIRVFFDETERLFLYFDYKNYLFRDKWSLENENLNFVLASIASFLQESKNKSFVELDFTNIHQTIRYYKDCLLQLMFNYCFIEDLKILDRNKNLYISKLSTLNDYYFLNKISVLSITNPKVYKTLYIEIQKQINFLLANIFTNKLDKNLIEEYKKNILNLSGENINNTSLWAVFLQETNTKSTIEYTQYEKIQHIDQQKEKKNEGNQFLVNE